MGDGRITHKNVFAAGFDCPNTQVEFGGDLAGAAAFANEAEDLELAVDKLRTTCHLPSGSAGRQQKMPCQRVEVWDKPAA